MANEQKPQLGVINEIGDLGLGFDPLTPEERAKLEEQEEKK